MRVFHALTDGVNTWSTASRQVAVVAADADALAGMLERGEVHYSWRLFGSPAQAQGLYLAARPEFADSRWFAGLEIDGKRLLPGDAEASWLPLSLAELREHAGPGAGPAP